MPGVTKSEVIRGLTPQQLYDVVIDYESYPGYFADFSRVKVLAKRENVWEVEFTAKVVVEVSYTLAITHDPAAHKTRWSFLRGSMVTDSRGGWTFTAVPEGTRIDYDASMEVNAPLPGFIKNKIQDAILNRSVGTLFQQLEKETRRRAR